MYHTPDEEVYLPGRNIVLLGKAGVYCAAADLDRLVIGTLDHNPFPDATSAWAQPTIASGRVFVGSQNGTVFSLDAKTGCIYWTFSANGGVRTAVTIGPP